MAPSTGDKSCHLGGDETKEANDQTTMNNNSDIASALEGKEITGLDIFKKTSDHFTEGRVQELISAMNTDAPTGGNDMKYGDADSQYLRFWKAERPGAPVVVFVHGGSWQVGTHLDSIGSGKVRHLLSQGYAFATVNFSLVPSVTVEAQVQEVAQAVGYLTRNCDGLGIDSRRLVLMGHSSGAHVVTLLGTDASYLEREGVDVSSICGVIALDGSNYNAVAELLDNPGPIARNMVSALGTDPARLRAMSPTYHARGPNAKAFLLLHAQRHGDIRQAVEFAAALEASDTTVSLHVFEGQSFEGHVQLLLRLGELDYPATTVMDQWLRKHVPID